MLPMAGDDTLASSAIQSALTYVCIGAAGNEPIFVILSEIFNIMLFVLPSLFSICFR